MENEVSSPRRWAIDVSRVLREVFGNDRFPVPVEQVAREFSVAKYPDDPISLIHGSSLSGFEGGLFKDPEGHKGWAIIYNSDITSPGRINFTLAHEFGHYLVHRARYPEGIQCTQKDMAGWGSEYERIEREANEFAAWLLMPLDDFRRQIDSDHMPSLDELGTCAERYGVSLMAAILRWLDYTKQRAVLVLSRDNYVLWARSSRPALRSGAFIRTKHQPPVPIPTSSLAAERNQGSVERSTKVHDEGVWFQEPCIETALASDTYEFTLSLIQLRVATGLGVQGEV